MSRRNFSDDEKRAYVDAWKESGLARAAYAAKVGISKSVICEWVKRFGNRPRPRARTRTPAPAAQRGETLEQLRLENTVLKAVLRLAESQGFKLWRAIDE